MAGQSFLDITKILNNYAEEITEKIIESADTIANEGKNRLKTTTHTYKVKSGRYNKGWKVSKKSGTNFVNRTIYNATDYQLTHLLEKGHATRNGGRTQAFVHIAPVEAFCNQEFEKQVEQIIKESSKK